MIERVAHGAFDDPAGFDGLQPPLVLARNSGSRMNTEISAAQVAITSSAVSAAARLVWPMRSA